MRDDWGSVRKLGTNYYEVRWWEDGVHRGHRIHGTRKQANAFRAQKRVEVGEDGRRCVTVGQAYRKWWLPEIEERHAAGELSDSIVRQYENSWRNYVAPTWETTRVDAVKGEGVQDWLLAKADGDGSQYRMTQNVAKIARIVMSGVMNKAVIMGAVKSNPMVAKYRMPKQASTYDSGVWNLKSLVELWEHLRGGVVEAPFILQAFGGCRVGESLGVMVGEMRLEESHGVPVMVCPISRQVGRLGDVSERLKTKWSRRPAVIPGPMALRLLELADAARAEGQDYLANDGLGGPMSQNTVAQNWDGEHPMRNLRNSWQTNCRWELKMPPWIIERMMGHVGEGVTGQHYDRPEAEMFVAAMAEAYAANPFAG